MIEIHTNSVRYWSVYFYTKLIVLKQTESEKSKLHDFELHPSFWSIFPPALSIGSVGNGNINSSTVSTLHLPISTSRQTFGAQDLSPADEALWVIRVWLPVVTSVRSPERRRQELAVFGSNVKSQQSERERILY